MTKIARTVPSPNESIIFDSSRPGHEGYSLPALDVPEVAPDELLGDLTRGEIEGMPELSENMVVRHYTRLSTWNYGVDTGFYPLGSCTMKYNPKVNELVARYEGFLNSHPLASDDLCQGNLRVIWELCEDLKAITGLDGCTLQPAAGAHGEFTGIRMIRAYLEHNGDARKVILIPDSAHGTNPATAVLSGYSTKELKSDERGCLNPETVRAAMDDSVAGIMLTNPNTLGIFEEEIAEICKIVHEGGGLVYMDGANLNALMGKTRPGDFGVDVMHINLHKTFSTPHGGGGPGAGPVVCNEKLVPFLPCPRVIKVDDKFATLENCPETIGRVKGFQGNFGVLVRALAYIRALGPDGIKKTSEIAVLNANYIRARLKDTFNLTYTGDSLHEVILNDKHQEKENGVTTMDIAKRLIDYGFHPMTVYFPLIVHGAMMIEPTESESKESLDAFCDAMLAIAEEAKNDPELVKSAPHITRVGRMDEVKANRTPVLRWKAESAQ